MKDNPGNALSGGEKEDSVNAEQSSQPTDLQGSERQEQGLLPCPFCGSHAHLRRTAVSSSLSADFDAHWAECVICEIGTKYHDSPEAASETWNSRTPSAIAAQWLPIEFAPPYKTLLTIHEDDLFPVCAFYSEQNGQRYWMRIIEGPEDVIRTEQGDHGELYRAPTHFMPVPPSPVGGAKCRK